MVVLMLELYIWRSTMWVRNKTFNIPTIPTAALADCHEEPHTLTCGPDSVDTSLTDQIQNFQTLNFLSAIGRLHDICGEGSLFRMGI